MPSLYIQVRVKVLLDQVKIYSSESKWNNSFFKDHNPVFDIPELCVFTTHIFEYVWCHFLIIYEHAKFLTFNMLSCHLRCDVCRLCPHPQTHMVWILGLLRCYTCIRIYMPQLHCCVPIIIACHIYTLYVHIYTYVILCMPRCFALNSVLR